MKKYCAYYRVSTKAQGQSGAGLSAQREAVKQYINGGAKIVREFKEIESGKKSDRPVLAEAIAYCQKTGACLVASKIDRIARSLWLFESIKRSGIDFEIVGLPKNPLVQQVLASIAEWEAKAISERTKSALAQKRKQGVALGYNRPEVKAGLLNYWQARKKEIAKEKASRPPIKKGPSAREKADKAIVPTLKVLRSQRQNYANCAKVLNESGLLTRRGHKWTERQIIRVCLRNNIRKGSKLP